MALVLIYVLLDFTIDIRPPNIHSSYRFTLAQSPLDQPVFLRQDNLTILLIYRSKQLIEYLSDSGEDLQDPNSISSRQPEYAFNILRSRTEGYFVAYGLGTDLGCPLVVGTELTLKESCGTARYDFAGRAIAGQNQFHNLTIPDYNFSSDFSVLTINP